MATLVQPVSLDFEIVIGTIFGPYDFFALDEDDDPVDLTGCIPLAEARTRAGGRLLLDLGLVLTDGPGGQITLPKITDEVTWDWRPVNGVWSMIIEFPNGDRIGPYFEGAWVQRATAAHPVEA